MSTYELDDELVRQTLRTAQELPRAFEHALKSQLPIPAPELAGAIVKTVGAEAGREDEVSHFLRWTTDNFTHSPWIEVGNHDVPWRTDQIGRITEVIAPGRDLVIR